MRPRRGRSVAPVVGCGSARGETTVHDVACDRFTGLSGWARPFTRIEVHRAANAVVLDAWADLEKRAPCSIYQTRAWLLPWIATLGLKAGVTPLFVIARDRDDQATVLLCLCLRRRGPLRIAIFLGGKDSNLNMALIRPEAKPSARDLHDIFSATARHLGADAPDVYALANQPLIWDGVRNPLADAKAQPSPSAAYGLKLSSGAEALFARKLSNAYRKKLRKKEARLAGMGPLFYHVPVRAKDRALILDAFFAQKVARLSREGIASDFDHPAMRRFVEMANTETGDGVGVELHALTVGDRVVAVYGGASHKGHWSGMFNSYDADPEISKSSPGELLLMAVIAGQCAGGQTEFDLGIGEARYKAVMCDEDIPLFDSFLPMTTKGAIFATTLALATSGKRLIKQNPALMRWVRRLRASPLGRGKIRIRPD